MTTNAELHMNAMHTTSAAVHTSVVDGVKAANDLIDLCDALRVKLRQVSGVAATTGNIRKEVMLMVSNVYSATDKNDTSDFLLVLV